jgi:hypothetical protein
MRSAGGTAGAPKPHWKANSNRSPRLVREPGIAANTGENPRNAGPRERVRSGSRLLVGLETANGPQGEQKGPQKDRSFQRARSSWASMYGSASPIATEPPSRPEDRDQGETALHAEARQAAGQDGLRRDLAEPDDARLVPGDIASGVPAATAPPD